MGSGMWKSYRIHGLCSVLVLAFLIAVPALSAWSSAGAGGTAALEASSEIISDPLGRLPGTPEEAHERLAGREVGWPEEAAGAGDRSADAVSSGVRVSIPYNTVDGRTTSAAGTGVTVQLWRGAVLVQVDQFVTVTNAERYFGGTFPTDAVQSGDVVRVIDAGGGQVDINCTLTSAITVATDTVSGTAAAANSAIDVYVVTPSTYMGDIPPAAAHKSTVGTAWTTSFADTLNIRSGDAAYIYSTDANGNRVMDVARTGGRLAVYPQYDNVLGFYNPNTLLTVDAGAATQNVGTGGDGFFEAWFQNYDILPGQVVSCQMGASNRSITVADVTAKCDPGTNIVSGAGPANRTIRVTMDPYGAPVTIQSATDGNGDFSVNLGGSYTATGTDVYNIAWYNAAGDCVVYEFQTFSWHLAEGYTGPGFDTWVMVQNPGDLDAEAAVTFQVQGGAADPVWRTVPANSRDNIKLNALPGLSGGVSVSTKVTSTTGAPLNAERAMYFTYGGKQGGHDSIGALTPSRAWYLAEGYTGAGFDTYVMVQNPGTADATVTLEFQLDKGTAPDKVINVPAGTRNQVHLNQEAALAAGVSVSTKVTSNVPVVAERAMYFNYGGKQGGHDSIAVTSPRKTWYLAEGYTGAGFDTYITVQNPTTEAATVTLSYQLDSGTAPDKVLNLPAGTRDQVHLNKETGLSGGVSVSTRVTSNVDVVAERAMYFIYGGKDGGHGSRAVEALSMGWYLPEGYTGLTGPGQRFDTYITVQNPGATSATVTLKFQLDSGTAPDYSFTLPARTRDQVHLNVLPVLSDGVSVSTTVVATRPVAAERSVYFNNGGLLGGHNSVGIPFVP